MYHAISQYHTSTSLVCAGVCVLSSVHLSYLLSTYQLPFLLPPVYLHASLWVPLLSLPLPPWIMYLCVLCNVYTDNVLAYIIDFTKINGFISGTQNYNLTCRNSIMIHPPISTVSTKPRKEGATHIKAIDTTRQRGSCCWCVVQNVAVSWWQVLLLMGLPMLLLLMTVWGLNLAIFQLSFSLPYIYNNICNL